MLTFSAWPQNIMSEREKLTVDLSATKEGS
jgi:hypothetical protein